MDSFPEFEALNPLEVALVKACGGAVSIDEFLERMLESQVFVLFDKALTPGERNDNAMPLVLNSQEGRPMLAVFTAPERAAGWPARMPAYSFGLLTDFRWLLKGIASGVGLVVNPGSRVGFEMPASGVSRLRAEVLARPSNPSSERAL